MKLGTKLVNKVRARQNARKLLIQALYSLEVGGSDAAQIEEDCLAEKNMSKVDEKFFQTALHAIAKDTKAIDTIYSKYLDRENIELDPTSRAILRLTSYEMINHLDIPFKVVINEGVNLAKTYAPTDAFKFINGVLDELAISSRSSEKTIISS